MRVSVTGASGFLGKKIISMLQKDGHHPIAWVRDPPVSGFYGECRSFDLEHAEDMDLSTSDALIHCAAYLPSNYEDISEAEKCLAINGIGTLKILQAAERDALKKVVHLSTGQIYSWKGPTDEATEDCKLDSIERATPYLISKWVGDTYVRAHKGKVRTAVLRPSYIYGPGMKSRGLLQRMIDTLRAGQHVSMKSIGNYNVDMVYVDDVARMACNAATSDITGVYNVGGGGAVSTLGLLHDMASVMGKSIATDTTPLELDRCHPSLNIDKAISVGYQPTSRHDGLERYWKSLNG